MNIRRLTTAKDPCWEKVNALFVASFPENERRDLTPLLQPDQEIGFVYILEEGAEFLGFACFLDVNTLSHIIYFAVQPELRGRGIGKEALTAFCELKKGMRVIADLEEIEDSAPNNAQRIARRRFYTKCGFAPTSVRYNWRNEDYIIYSRGGDVTNEEFWHFWDTLETAHVDLLY